jgi:phenylalanyl-tRNA synthetase beta chain
LNHSGSIGAFGEVNQKLLKKFEIDSPVYLIEIDLHKLYNSKRKQSKFTPVSPYPSITRDLAFLAGKEITAKDMLAEIRNKAGKLLTSLKIFDVYEGKNLEPGKKSIAFSLSFSSNERTLKDEEVTTIVDKIVTAIENKFKAQLRKF